MAEPRGAPASTPPQRRFGTGRVAGLVGLFALGLLAFLLLLDVTYNQDDPTAPWFTGEMSRGLAEGILVGFLAVMLVAAVGLLVTVRRQETPWSAGATCTVCGSWAPNPEGRCPTCGSAM